jgi:hypothetical protein
LTAVIVRLDRAIQYSGAFEQEPDRRGDWIPAFRGYDELARIPPCTNSRLAIFVRLGP